VRILAVDHIRIDGSGQGVGHRGQTLNHPVILYEFHVPFLSVLPVRTVDAQSGNRGFNSGSRPYLACRVTNGESVSPRFG